MGNFPSRASHVAARMLRRSGKGIPHLPTAMKTFQCSCRQPLFFDNQECLKCGSSVGYDPASLELSALRPAREAGRWQLARDSRQPAREFRFCANRGKASHCNWLVPIEESNEICLCCRLTRTVPALDRPRNPERLRTIESAKRGVLFALQGLGLPIEVKVDANPGGLVFDLLEALPDGPVVLTGHADGVITLNVAEADDDYRERFRENLGEPYRTIVGHLRHELAHYYWDVLVRDTPWLMKFRALFGSEETDYGAALGRYYAAGPQPDWRTRFISAYASSHPWEDWAESFAHYLHLTATLETATSYQLSTSPGSLHIDPFTADVLYEKEPAAVGEAFLGRINAWVLLTAVLNEVARSMGRPDIYPFVMNGPVVTKLHFVHCIIHDHRPGNTEAQPSTLAVPQVEAGG